MYRALLNLASGAVFGAQLSTLIFHRVLPKADELFPGEVDAARFDRLCAWVRDWFNVLPLDEALLRLQRGTLPARAMSITFDDGYEDNHSVALPILQAHGLSATFFIATGFLDGGCMWNDKVIEAIRRAPRPTLDLRRFVGADLGLHDLATPALRRSAIDLVLNRTKYLQPDDRARMCNYVLERAGVEPPRELMMRSDQVRSLRRAGMQIGAHTPSHTPSWPSSRTPTHGKKWRRASATSRHCCVSR